MEPTVIKGFYELLTMIVDGLNNLGGVLPVVSAGIAGLATAFIAVNAGLSVFATLGAGAAAIFGTLIVAGGIGAGLGGIFGLFDQSAEKYAQAVEKMTEAEKKVASLETAKSGLAEMLKKVQSGAELTAAELKSYQKELDTVASISPTAEAAVRQLTSGYADQASILDILIGKTDQAIETQ